MADVSPTKWHRAHTTWFFETFVLGPHQPGYEPVDPGYDYLFNSYYEQVGPRHPRAERGLISRPTVAEVAAYRAAVDDALGVVHRRRRPTSAGTTSVPLIELGIHHEQQHQELLLMDIKHVLSCNPLRPAYRRGGRHRPSRGHGGRPRVGRRRPGRHRRRRPRGAGLLVRQRGPPPRRPARSRSASPTGSSPPASGSRSSPTAATSGPSSGCPRAGPPSRRGLGGAALLGARRRRLGRVHPRRPAPGRPGRAGRPRQLLRGRRLRPLGRRPAAHRGRVGGRGRRTAASATRPTTWPRAAPAPRRAAAPSAPASARPAARSGSGPRRPTCPYPGFRPAARRHR